MARTSLSGFPEWLPEGRIVEMHVLDELRPVEEKWAERLVADVLSMTPR